MMEAKSILITGATGFLGSRTLEYLAAEYPDTQFIASGRTLREEAKVSSKNVEYILGDLVDMEYVKTLFRSKPNVVIHCAALSSPWGKAEEFYEANVLTQKNLLNLAYEAGCERYIYISTPSIYFNFKPRYDIKESEPLPAHFVNHYASTKREAELMLESQSIPYVSLRPRALIGRGDTVILPRLIRAVEEGRLRIIGDGENVVDLTPVSNVVQAIECALKAPREALNQHYNISNGAPVKLWDSIFKTLEALDLKVPTQKLPVSIARTIARGMELIAQLSGSSEPVLTQYSVGTLAYDFTMNIDKAKTLLSYHPLQTTDEAIEEFVHWYKEKNNEV
ncbi:NAD-dependent epimerase/dehydratase family protein [bacterium]|nr:NAD-dependent epimerase/dehydratase family protein [bacterium]